jgi:hypothetical protein
MAWNNVTATADVWLGNLLRSEHMLPCLLSLLGGGDDDPPTGMLLAASLGLLHPLTFWMASSLHGMDRVVSHLAIAMVGLYGHVFVDFAPAQ